MAAASAAGPPTNVFPFRDARAAPDPVLEAGPVAHGPLPVPLVLDNGSFQARAGWACPGSDPGPEPRLQFRAVCARGRGGARGGAGPQVGNALGSLEPLRWMLRSPFDRNVPVNLELQELLLDYSFQHLGVSSQGCVDHPIVLTEAVCNPLYSRQMMSELLFECYGIPTVAYGIDSLFSFYHNNPKNLISSGLIISSGYQCTHILPILEGRLDAKNCKRINLGGSQATGYLQRLLQLKYPGHLAAITLSRMEEILHEHSYIAEDYVEELQKWRCPDYYENNVHKMQLPFSSKLLGSTLTSEEKQERRQQQLRRLQELNARRREEKLQLDQERLDRLLYVQELLEDGQMDQFHKALIELNMDSPEELQSYIQKLSAAVEQAKQKILQAEASLEVDVVDSKPETPDLGQLEPSLEDVENINDFEPLFSEETPEVEKPVTTVQPVFNLAAYHQLFVGTERIRAPEIIFQPSLIGEEQAGIAETLQYILDRFSWPRTLCWTPGTVLATGPWTTWTTRTSGSPGRNMKRREEATSRSTVLPTCTSPSACPSRPRAPRKPRHPAKARRPAEAGPASRRSTGAPPGTLGHVGQCDRTVTLPAVSSPSLLGTFGCKMDFSWGEQFSATGSYPLQLCSFGGVGGEGTLGGLLSLLSHG
ncbi:actin-related protein 5 isoform X1 [Balaenoptera acutorostrata]|uniref:Actin-related protein 5 isoform X1 n=1 Tax=Balaenoptera acutorostrata TaxID=9767 RepID=A0ABM3S7D8_BALAC|nr:actin-related protein 5 isoform X1 [Balaenoptera acutorostrata]